MYNFEGCPTSELNMQHIIDRVKSMDFQDLLRTLKVIDLVLCWLPSKKQYRNNSNINAAWYLDCNYTAVVLFLQIIVA